MFLLLLIGIFLISGAGACLEEPGISYVLPSSALLEGHCFPNFYSSAACCADCLAYQGQSKCVAYSWIGSNDTSTLKNNCCLYSQIPTNSQRVRKATYVSALQDCGYYQESDCKMIQKDNNATTNLCSYCVDSCQSQKLSCTCSAVSDSSFMIGMGAVASDITTICNLQKYAAIFSETAKSLNVPCNAWKAISGIYAVNHNESPKHDVIQCWESRVQTAAHPYDSDFFSLVSNYNFSVYPTGPREVYNGGNTSYTTMVTSAQTNDAQCGSSSFAAGIYDTNYEQDITAAIYEYLLNLNANAYNKSISVQSQKVNPAYALGDTWVSKSGVIFSQSPATLTEISTSVSLYVCEMSVVSSGGKLLPQTSILILVWFLVTWAAVH